MKVPDILEKENPDYSEPRMRHLHAYRRICSLVSSEPSKNSMGYIDTMARNEISPHISIEGSDMTPEFRGKTASFGMAFLKQYLQEVDEDPGPDKGILPVILGIKLLGYSGNLRTSLTAGKIVDKILEKNDYINQKNIINHLQYNLKTIPSPQLIIEDVIPEKKTDGTYLTYGR